MSLARPDPAVDYSLKPKIQTQPHFHFCSVIERCDIEERIHSSQIDVYDGGIKLDGRRNRPRLVEILAVGPGRWVDGRRQPAEVTAGSLVYVKERTVPFRLHLRAQNHFYIPMDGVMAELDLKNVRIRPLGAYVMTREVEERARVAIMGNLPFHVAKTMGVEKKGEEADDIGCNKTRIEEVVAVGRGKFGGWRQRLEVSRGFAGNIGGPPELGPVTGVQLVDEPWYETPEVKEGDLIVFSDMARPTEITVAGRKFTLFELDFGICTVLDRDAV